MKDDVLDRYREAGRIAHRVLSTGVGMVRPGAGVLETVEALEAMVLEADAGLAFPLNCSFNEAAAHDTASEDDERVFSQGDLVKLDLGVHLDGYVADTAVTIDLGDHAELVLASRTALDAAIAHARPGVTTGELGAAIQAAIEGYGFRPVANLTARSRTSSPPRAPSVPNVATGGSVMEGQVVAIEPFASTGRASSRGRASNSTVRSPSVPLASRADGACSTLSGSAGGCPSPAAGSTYRSGRLRSRTW